MNIPMPCDSRYTLEDWAQWEGRWELIDGEAYDMSAAPNTDHQGISLALAVSLVNAMNALGVSGGKAGCRTFQAPTDLFLGENVLEPDLMVVCDPAKVSLRGVEGAPDLVVEILSPSSASRDTVTKRSVYEAAGVPEYLLVYPEEKRAILLRLAEGRYQEALRAEWGQALSLLGGRISIPLGG